MLPPPRRASITAISHPFNAFWVESKRLGIDVPCRNKRSYVEDECWLLIAVLESAWPVLERSYSRPVSENKLLISHRGIFAEAVLYKAV